MARAWREIPMVPLKVEADVTETDHERKLRQGPSWTALIARALALTLPAHRGLNACFLSHGVAEMDDINLSIAVALPDGLAVPVLRAAQTMVLAEIADEIGRLATAARDGSLAADSQSDGTFTLSNLGAAAIDSFQPIINPPQVAILGAARARAAIVPGGEGPTTRLQMALTLVFDHRALDGQPAAHFLAAVATTLADPARLWG